MCQRPDFEGMDLDMDNAVIDLLRKWYGNLACWAGEDEARTDWLESFCADVRNALIRLQDTSELKTAIGLE